MKKLKLTINDEVKTFDLSENGECKVEVVNKYVPKVGDCVRTIVDDLGRATFFKIGYILGVFSLFILKIPSINFTSSTLFSSAKFFNNACFVLQVPPKSLKIQT